MKGWILKWFIPLLILLVITAQFFMVYKNNLTRWKGGGFGMYSEIHPLDKRVWIVTKDSNWVIMDRKSSLGKMAHTLRFFPNEKALNEFAKKAAVFYKIDTFSIEIWEPHLNPHTNILSKKITARTIYPNK